MHEILRDKRVAGLAVILALGAIGASMKKTGEGGPDYIKPDTSTLELTRNAFTESYRVHTKLEGGVATWIVDNGDGTFSVSKDFCDGKQLMEVFDSGNFNRGKAFSYSGEPQGDSGKSFSVKLDRDVCADQVLNKADNWLNDYGGLRLYTVADSRIEPES
jgi:hypothetical protein